MTHPANQNNHKVNLLLSRVFVLVQVLSWFILLIFFVRKRNHHPSEEGQTSALKKANLQRLRPEISEPSRNQLWINQHEGFVGYQKQAHITWWSILQGLALGALLTTTESVINTLSTPRWYTALYFVATALITLNLWASIVWGIQVLRWPITMGHMFMLFTMGFSTSIAAVLVEQPLSWYIAIAVLVIFSAALILKNILSGAHETL